MKSISWRKIGSVLLVLYGVWAVANVWGHKDLQWDFQEYYHSAQAYAQGINPYGMGIPTTQGAFPHVYPPLSLSLFRPLAPMSYPAAFDIYLVLKCLALIGLIGLWRKAFLDKKAGFFFLFCLLAFNSAIGLDLRAGNIGGFEQLLIWLAFFFFIKKRYSLFCGTMVLAATFKLQPLLFLFLILLTDEKKKFLYLSGSLMFLGLISSIGFLTDPVLFKAGALGDYLKNLSYMTGERGIFHPSIFAIVRDLVSLLSSGLSPALANSISWGVYTMVFSGILLLSWKAYLRIHAAGGEDRDKRIVFLACFVYALSACRFKDYSFILLILPSYVVIQNSRLSSKGLLLFLAGIAAISFPLPGSRIVFTFLFEYYPLLFAFLMWGIYLHEIQGLSVGDTSKPDVVPATQR